MMKKICVVTGTRAEYGLLRPLIERLRQTEDMQVQLVVTGTHLSPEWGMTAQEILRDQIPIDKKIEIVMSADTPTSISKSMGLGMISFGEYLDEKRPDLVVVLGDRYEILALVTCAVIAKIPVAHLHGGEVTEGAYDELFRHAITKLSTLHFTSNEIYRSRVIQMGEAPERVYNVGALGVENVLKEPLMSRQALTEALDFPLQEAYGVVTYHPTTLGEQSVGEEIQELLGALATLSEIRWIFTYANADEGGRLINQAIRDYVAKHPNQAIAFQNLGSTRYLSLVKHSACVVGNSSSGILEVPSLGVPTIDIGERQKGRVRDRSVLHCSCHEDEIVAAIRLSQTESFRPRLKDSGKLYGNGETSRVVCQILRDFLRQHQGCLKKEFYDIPYLK